MIDATTLAIGLLAGGFWILAAVSVILVFPLFGSLICFGVRGDW